MKFLNDLFGKNAAVVKSVTKSTAPGIKKTTNKDAPYKGTQTSLASVVLPPDFTALDLPDALGKSIIQLGFPSCTPVQKEVLPHSLDGKDIIAQAQTGTGKTAAFLISILTYHIESPEINQRPSGCPFALVIAPTRELVLQITADAVELSEHVDFTTIAVVGGMDYEKQKTQLRQPVDLVVATPGRLLDFLRSNVIDLSKIEVLIIDEADRMLSMGFIPDVKSIIQRTPRKERRQTQLFSATFSEDIKRLATNWTLDPARIAIEPERLATTNVEQLVYLTSAEQKFTLLYNLICSEAAKRVIVFANRRDEARDIETRLYRQGIACGLLSGEVAQKKRISTLDAFKSSKIKVLVATDVAGRGIHVAGVSHVINYNLPEDPEDYIHRIGRTGRAGVSGISISLACEDEAFMLPDIESLLGKAFVCQQPSAPMMAKLPAPIRGARKQSLEDKRPARQQRHRTAR